MKAGIIGAGFIGQEHLNAMLTCGITDICICDKNAEQAKQMAEKCKGRVYSDYIEMLEAEHPDYISVCTPTVTHYAATMAALERGVSVLCEKPFSAGADEAEKMISKAKEKGCLLMVAHCLRFAQQYAYLKNCIEDGRFGKLRSLSMYRHSTEPGWSAENWMKNMTASGGAAVDLHIHETDMVVFLLGMPDAVTSVGDYEQCSTVYHYNDKKIAVSAEGSWRPVRSYPFTSGFNAGFERASLHCEGNNLRVFSDDLMPEDVLKQEKFPDYITGESQYVCEMRYFLQCLPTRRAPRCNPGDSLLSLKTVHGELESIMQKKTVILK